MNETYTKRVKCNNCGHEQSLGIEKGVTVQIELETELCPHCGCKEFIEDTSKPVMGEY